MHLALWGCVPCVMASNFVGLHIGWADRARSHLFSLLRLLLWRVHYPHQRLHRADFKNRGSWNQNWPPLLFNFLPVSFYLDPSLDQPHVYLELWLVDLWLGSSR